MELLVDTTQKGQIVFEILEGRTSLARFEKITARLSEEILSLLQKFMSKNKVKLRDVKKILVNPGPGPFSSTRTGVATANALAYVLAVPLAEWPSGRIKEAVLPKYDRVPNITRPK